MASSTNHQEQSNHSGAVASESAAASKNDMNLQQEQQQELIKLLAQHFHHQFYQLTSNGSNNTYNNINSVDTISNDRSQNSSGNRQSPLYHQASSAVAAAAAIQQQQQQQQQGTFPGQSLDFALLSSTTACGRLDGLNQSMNLISPSSTSTTPTSSSNTHNQLLHNYNHQHHHNHLRSQPNTGANLTTISNGPESLADFATLGQNLYSLNDLNLLSALGMNNLTSNQLVVSLQQQSLLQAATARQYELNRNFKVEEQFQLQQIRQHHQQQQQQQQQQHPLHRAAVAAAGKQNILNKRNNSNDIIDPEGNNNPVDVQKGMLKFSINTILGRGSPQSMSTSETFNSSNSFGGEQTNKLNRLKSFTNFKEDRYQQPIAVDCDPSIESSDDGEDHDDDDDDSNSTTNNSTPRPQSMNNSNSVMINQSPTINFNATTTAVATIHDHHHRANQLANTLNSLSNNHQQTLRHSAQQHPNPNHHQHHHHHTSLPFLPGSTAFPWTVAARGKPRRGMMRRAVFSDSQRVGLEKRFQLQKYISKPDRKKLAEKLGLRDSQVKIWFQNRRMKWRNSKERELLSAGGSREQTLPTRNNPNPDLSDVGETIKRLTTTNNITNTTVSLAE